MPFAAAEAEARTTADKTGEDHYEGHHTSVLCVCVCMCGGLLYSYVVLCACVVGYFTATCVLCRRVF